MGRVPDIQMMTRSWPATCEAWSAKGEINNQERGLTAIILLFKIKDRVLGLDVTAFTFHIFLRRISLVHQEESFATPGKCNVDTSLCDRCQDTDQRWSFTWMEYSGPSDSYCDPLARFSIQQHFVKSCIQRDFRHPFMSSQFNSHYSPTLLSLSIQTQSQLVGVSSS